MSLRDVLRHDYPSGAHAQVEIKCRSLGVVPTWVVDEKGIVRYLQLWLFDSPENPARYQTFRITAEALADAVDGTYILEHSIRKMKQATAYA